MVSGSTVLAGAVVGIAATETLGVTDVLGGGSGDSESAAGGGNLTVPPGLSTALGRVQGQLQGLGNSPGAGGGPAGIDFGVPAGAGSTLGPEAYRLAAQARAEAAGARRTVATGTSLITDPASAAETYVGDPGDALARIDPQSWLGDADPGQIFPGEQDGGDDGARTDSTRGDGLDLQDYGTPSDGVNSPGDVVALAGEGGKAGGSTVDAIFSGVATAESGIENSFRDQVNDVLDTPEQDGDSPGAKFVNTAVETSPLGQAYDIATGGTGLGDEFAGVASGDAQAGGDTGPAGDGSSGSSGSGSIVPTGPVYNGPDPFGLGGGDDSGGSAGASVANPAGDANAEPGSTTSDPAPSGSGDTGTDRSERDEKDRSEILGGLSPDGSALSAIGEPIVGGE